MDEPRHALAAPSHPRPYGWYARLRETQPLFFDAGLALWVASGGALVRAALGHPLLRVRPPDEPVPRALRGRATGEVFAQLVRMNDGAFHAAHRPRVAAAAARFDDAGVEAAAAAAVRDLAPRSMPDDLLTAMPVQAMARLLGVRAEDLDATVQAVRAFTAGIAAGADAATIEAADAASVWLMAQGEREGLDRVAAANRIALMQQAQDATAGLIGNAIARAPAVPAQAGTHASHGFANPEPGALVAHAARHDPPIHNTRRFAGADLELAGQRIAAGQGVLLVLVDEDHPLGFGAGPHACPGERIALRLATGALRALHEGGWVSRFGAPRGYRPLPNARIPLFNREAP